jgi:hypothetical protein
MPPISASHRTRPGLENAKALQHAVSCAGTIVVSRPGTCKAASTVYLGSNTSLAFSDSVFLKKVAEQGPFTHVFLNQGALTKSRDRHLARKVKILELNPWVMSPRAERLRGKRYTFNCGPRNVVLLRFGMLFNG